MKIDPIKAKFCQVLIDYKETTGIPLTQLADIMGKPRRTVRKWADRLHGPHKKEIPLLCASLGWNYKAIFTNASTADVFFEQQVLGFEVLQQRYLNLKLKDPFAALSFLVQAGALGFVYLLKAGVEGTLMVESNFSSRMMLTGLGFEDLLVRFEARDYSGLGFYVMDVRGNMLTQWSPLINTNLDTAINIIYNLQKHERTNSSRSGRTSSNIQTPERGATTSTFN